MRLTSQRENEIRDLVRDTRPGAYGGLIKVVGELLDEIDRLRDDKFVEFMAKYEVKELEHK
jgi:hypothetical protein